MEVCVDNLESAVNAEKGGASKLELCSTNNDGGLTPSLGLLRIIKKSVKIPVIVMIRPRTGDYIYSDEEVEIMSEDIKIFKENGADGFVFGIVTPEGKVDIKNCSKLVKLAGNLPVTYSRAFDVIKDPLERMEEIISLGFHRILTSGLQETANEGIPLLKQLSVASMGRIVIMPGAGIKPNNLLFLLKETNAVEFHASAGKLPKKGHFVTDHNVVRKMVTIFRQPRSGDFIYSDEEIEVMSEDLEVLKENGADGFVFGITTPEGKVDVKNCLRLMQLAGNRPVTYHRAFDVIKEPLESLEEIIALGFQRILTSGLKENACQGASLIKELISASRGRIIIMPGAGIKPDNLHVILKETNPLEFHGSAKAPKSDYFVTDINSVKEMVTLFKSMSEN